MLSKARSNVPATTGDLNTTEVAAFPIWEVFTKKKEGDIHLHAGSLSAPDADFAQQFAREHYGQDQECVNMWVATRDDRSLPTMVQTKRMNFSSNGPRAQSMNTLAKLRLTVATEAKTNCIKQYIGDKSFYTIWAAPISALTKIDSGVNMIWRKLLIRVIDSLGVIVK